MVTGSYEANGEDRITSSTHRRMEPSRFTIQDDDGNAYKVNGQRLKLFLDHNKALDEEIDVIDLVDPVLTFKKSHIGQKGRWAHPTSQTYNPTN